MIPHALYVAQEKRMPSADEGASVANASISPHFPRAPKACKPVAQVFFDCFTCEGKQPYGSQAYDKKKGCLPASLKGDVRAAFRPITGFS